MSVEPTPQVPRNNRISRDEANFPFARFRKVGESISFDKTFVEDIWDDERIWNDKNVWGS